MIKPLLFIIPAAIAIALLLLSIWRLAVSRSKVMRRQLLDRLHHDGYESAAASDGQSVRIQTNLKGFNAILVRWPGMGALYRSLLHSYPDLPLSRFMAIVLGLGVLGFVFCWLFMGSAIVGIAGAGVAGYLPFLTLIAKANVRQRQLANQIPEALDFLSRILRAGHSFPTGMQMLGEEMAAPLATEFKYCYNQHSLGYSMEDCLKDMAARIDSSDFAFFVTAVLIQHQTGGDLAEVLNNISGMIRERIRIQRDVKAKTAEGRLTGYVLVAFPVVMFLVISALSPQYAKELTGTSLGIKLLITAVILQGLGLFTIRRVTSVRV